MFNSNLVTSATGNNLGWTDVHLYPGFHQGLLSCVDQGSLGEWLWECTRPVVIVEGTIQCSPHFIWAQWKAMRQPKMLTPGVPCMVTQSEIPHERIKVAHWGGLNLIFGGYPLPRDYRDHFNKGDVFALRIERSKANNSCSLGLVGIIKFYFGGWPQPRAYRDDPSKKRAFAF